MIKCPVCKKEAILDRVINKDKYIGKKITYYKCEECGLEFIEPQPLKDLNKLYDKEYRDKISLRKKIMWSLPYSKHHKIPLQEIKKHFKKKGRVLDIGSSEGKLLHLLRIRGWKVEGVEPTKHYASFSRNFLKIKTHNKFLDAYKTKTKYDLVTLLNVFEHLYKPYQILGKIKNLLKDNGLLYIVVPTTKKGNHVYGAPHLFLYTEKSLKKIIEQSGLETIEIKMIKGSIHCWSRKKENSIK